MDFIIVEFDTEPGNRPGNISAVGAVAAGKAGVSFFEILNPGETAAGVRFLIEKFDRWLQESFSENPVIVTSDIRSVYMLLSPLFTGKILELASFCNGLGRDFEASINDFNISKKGDNALARAFYKTLLFTGLLEIYNMSTGGTDSGDFIMKAFRFALRKHEDQKRKFSGSPYIIHPVRVSEIVRKHGGRHCAARSGYSS